MSAPFDPRRRRLALLLPNLGGGGAERVAVVLCRRFVELGHQVDVVLLQAQGELLPLLPEDADVVDLGARRIRQGIAPLRRYLQAAQPDVVLASLWPLTVVAMLADRLAGGRCGRVVVSDHSILSASPQAAGWRKRLAVRMSIGIAYRFARARLAVSQGVADDIATLGRLDRSTMTVIGNPIAPRVEPAVGDAKSAVWPAALGKRILSVGALKAVKDQAMLIHAFARLRTRIEATLVILGEGSLRPSLERLIAELDLRGCVSLPGFAIDPSPWYAGADLFVLSSRNEGFGNVIVEALQHGTPVVSTDCRSGPREILDGGKHGRLVPVGDADALAAAMVETLEQPVDRDALRRRAADFSADAIAQRYLDVLFPGDGQPIAREATA